MATKITEEVSVKKENPILKKRTSPEDIAKQDEVTEKKSPLKKRTTPLDEPNAEKSVASLLKKRELPTEEKSVATPLKKKVNPLDIAKEEPKEKSSLDKMRERIAAQKKLEQDMMTQQSLRNQEKVNMRNKLSALTKDLNEEAEEDVDVVIPTPKAKPVINTDLKTEALEMQNKKLKSDLEKSKQQLQALLALEYQDMRVLDSSSLSLSDQFLESLNNLKEQYEAQKNLEEQSLKEELNSLQKELVDLKNKNAAAKKASDEARKAAAQAEKAIEETKRVIEEKENDQIRNFKEEIKELEKQIKEKEKQITQFKKEQEKIEKEFNQKIEVLNKEKEEQANEFKAENEKNKENELNLNNQIISLKEELANKEKLIKDGQKIVDENDELKAKLEQQEKDYQAKLQLELDKAFEKVTELNKQVNDLESLNKANDKVNEENKALENKLAEQEKRIVELSRYEQQLLDKQKEIDKLNSEIKALPSKDDISQMEVKIVSLEASVKDNANLQSKIDALLVEKTNLENSEQQLKSELEQLKQKVAEYTEKEQQQVEQERSAIFNAQISEIQVKIDENNKVAAELKEQYDRFIAAKEKLTSSFAVIRKYNTMLLELTMAQEAAKAVAEELSSINPKADKKAYKAKMAEVKSMNSKAIYLEKQMKKLCKNKNVVEYTKLLQKISEFDLQFEEINQRNAELNESIEKIKNN